MSIVNETVDNLNTHDDILINDEDYTSFFYLSSEPFLIAGVNGVILDMNDKFSSNLGYTKEEMIGQKFYTFIHPDDLVSTVHAQHNMYKGNKVLCFNNRYLSKTGEYVWISWNAIQKGDKLYARAELKNNNDELMSRIAHELKTPLTSIIGFTEIILMDEVSPDVKEYVEYIAKSGIDMEQMVNDLLDMSKITISNIHYENISINELLIDTIRSFTPNIHANNITINFHQTNSEHIINVDKDKMRQIFNNIISNGIKYNKKDGIIDITCVVEDNYLNIIFRDTGIGIAEDKLKELYMPFNRLGLTSEYAGTGIGLSYIKKIINIMNGKIHCNSILNEYTEFTVSFEIVEKVEKVNNTTFILNKKNNSKPNILYIEDVEAIVKLMKKIITKYFDCNFFFALNGEDGYELLKNNKIDVLLLDLGLPDIYGLDLYIKAKEAGYITNDTIVMVVSAEARAQTIDELYLAGIYEFIPKPIHIATFREKIEKILKN